MNRPLRAASWVAAVVVTVPVSADLDARREPSPGWIQRTIERSLSETVRGQVRFGSFEVDWLRLEARFRDARAEAVSPAGERAEARVESGRLTLSWAAVPGLAAGNVRISAVTLDRPRIRASADFVRSWSPARGAGRDLEVRLDRLEVENGEIDWSDTDAGLRVLAGEVRLEGTWSTSRRALSGTFSSRASLEARGFRDPLALALSGGFVQRPGSLEIHSVRASSRGATAEGGLRGTFGKGPTAWAGAADFRADAAAVASWFALEGASIEGHLSASTRIGRQPGEPLRIEGTVAAREAAIGRLRVPEVSAVLTVTPAGADLERVRGRLFGGVVEGFARLPFGGEGGASGELRVRGADGRSVVAAAGRELPLDTRLDADVGFTIPSGDPAAWAARASFDAKAVAGGSGVEVGGGGELRLASGRLRGIGVRLVAPALVGSIDIDLPLREGGPPGSVQWRTRTADAGPSQTASLVVLEGLGIALPKWIATPLRGSGTVDGDAVLSPPGDFSIRLDLRDGSWGDEIFDRARLEVLRAGDSIDIPSVAVVRGTETLEGSARFGAEPVEIAALDVVARSVRVGSLLERFAGVEGADGAVSGRITLIRGPEGFEGGGSFRLERGRFSREGIDLVRGTIVATGGRFDVMEGAIAGPWLAAEFAGSYAVSTGRATGTLRFNEARPGESNALREAGVPLIGVWSGAGRWDWTREDGPSARIDLDIRGLGVDGVLSPESTGSAIGPLTVEGGRVHVALEETSGRFWRLAGSLSLGDGFPFEATLALDRFVLDAPGVDRSTISALLSGSARIGGVLSEPGSTAIEASFHPFSLYVPGGRFDAAAPVVLTLHDGRLEFEQAAFVGEGATFDGSFAWSLDGGAVEGGLRGRADLSLLSLLRRELRGSGRLDVDVRLAGTIRAPTLDGRATVHDGRIRWHGLRQALDAVEAEVAFDGRRVRLESFRALTGGGEIQGRGDLALPADSAARFDVTVGVSGVSVEFPGGFRGLYDGALRLSGSNEESVLGGRLSLLRGLYDENFDLTRLGQTEGREVERSALEELPRGVRLDVEIEGADDVWLRNNLGRIEAGVSMRVGGNLRQPILTGRIVLFEGGRLRFRDVDYRLTAGSLEFDGEDFLNPFIEIRAETRVAEYDVRLRIAGSLDGFEYELTSYPTLQESDIIYLLLTGDVPTSAVATAGGGASGVPGGLAADYFAGVLTAGVARQLERTLGVDQFQINPLLESGQDPTARVTVGKQVTDRVRIRYTIDVGSVEEDTYLVEWLATRRWRLTAEQEPTGAYVGTAQFTDRYGRAGRIEGAPLPPADAASPESSPLRSVEVVGVDSGEARRLERVSGLEAGQTVRRAEIALAAETIRKDLIRSGRLDARVEARIADAADGAAVVFAVEKGAITAVRVEGLSGRLERAARRSLREFFEEGIPGLDREEEAAEIVGEELRLRGHYAADVLVRTEMEPPGGRLLRITVDPGSRIRATSVVLDGVSEIPEERVRKQVLTGRKEGLSSRPLSPAVLEEDARGILALYRREGYLDAEVDPPSVRLAIDGESAEVRFRVREGELHRVGAVEVAVEGPVEPEAIRAWSGLDTGRPASAAAWAEAARRIRAALDERGFSEARVSVRSVRESGAVIASIEVDTGARMRYAGTVVEGNFRTRDKIILREVGLAEGDVISGVRLREIQHRLYRLGVFQDVRVTLEPAPQAGPEATRIRVRVSEAKPVSLGVGLGYDTDAGARLAFGLGHDNVGGYNRSLTLQTRWSGREKRVQVVGRDPWLFNRRLVSTATYFWETLEENGYDLQRDSLAFRVERGLPSNWRYFLRYNFQQVDIDIYEITDDVIEAIREQKLQDLSLGDVGLTFARNTRDDSFLPTSGGYALGELRVFLPLLLSEESFAKVFLQGSATHTFERGASYSIAARVAAAKTFGSTTTVPLSERYFAGGSSTLRGFERDTVGLVVDGIPLGGEAMLIVNQEFRWPVWKGLHLVGFTDWGNVYTDLQSFDPTELRYTAGAGVRYDTPIGPLRLEYGHKLDRREGEAAGEFYFAVGTIY